MLQGLIFCISIEVILPIEKLTDLENFNCKSQNLTDCCIFAKHSEFGSFLIAASSQRGGWLSTDIGVA